MGGGTTKVGDPSGKDEARKLMTYDMIQSNIDSISQVFQRFLNFGNGPTDAVLVNNDEWLSPIKYLDFLRDYGQHFTINRMLNFESVKLRLDREQPLTLLEFNYMILQAYDFLELNRRHKAVLQLGGYVYMWCMWCTYVRMYVLGPLSCIVDVSLYTHHDTDERQVGPVGQHYQWRGIGAESRWKATIWANGAVDDHIRR